MIHLHLIGIGSGNPDHLTLQAIKTLNAADLVMIPRKGETKADLAELRREICETFITNPLTMQEEFDIPQRDAANPDYGQGVEDWHDAIAAVWSATIAAPSQRPQCRTSGLGRSVALRQHLAHRGPAECQVTVVPGITSLQALTAAHAIPLNDIGAPVTITTGRQLTDHGWPAGATTLAVMLDGACAFQTLDPAGITIWWGAYVGMPDQIILAGPLAETSARIIATRAQARAKHGWIMDIYLLRRDPHIT